jgi:hypothetical protein
LAIAKNRLKDIEFIIIERLGHKCFECFGGTFASL